MFKHVHAHIKQCNYFFIYNIQAVQFSFNITIKSRTRNNIFSQFSIINDIIFTSYNWTFFHLLANSLCFALVFYEARRKAIIKIPHEVYESKFFQHLLKKFEDALKTIIFLLYIACMTLRVLGDIIQQSKHILPFDCRGNDIHVLCSNGSWLHTNRNGDAQCFCRDIYKGTSN